MSHKMWSAKVSWLMVSLNLGSIKIEGKKLEIKVGKTRHKRKRKQNSNKGAVNKN